MQDDSIVILHCHGTIYTDNNLKNDQFKVTTGINNHNNLQGPNMPKYGFMVLLLLFSIKSMCLFDISCFVPDPVNAE